MTREEAIQVLKMVEAYGLADEAKRMAIEALQADRPRGKWIMHGEPPWYVRECSECGAKWHQWSGGSNPNYCGNCGANMDGERREGE